MGGRRGIQLRDRGNSLQLGCQNHVGPPHEIEFKSGCIVHPCVSASVRRQFRGRLAAG